MSAPAEARSKDSNRALVEAMGSKRGYDPMPPDQHEWQQATGQPPLYRLWSWMCAHTIRARDVKNEKVRTPYAAGDDGVTPLTLARAAKDLAMDLGHASNLWSSGVEAGLWHRDGKSRRLYLNGSVTVEQALAAKVRQVECTLNLSRWELLKIKEWPKEQQNRFYAVWKPAQELRAKLAAAAIAQVRDSCDGLDDNIRAEFLLPNKRLEKRRSSEPIEVPPPLLQFMNVHSLPAGVSVQSSAVECSVGEYEAESASVRKPHPYISEKSFRETLPSVGLSGPKRAPRPPAATGRPTQIAALCIEEWGRHLPGEILSPGAATEAAAELGEAPLDLLRVLMRRKVGKVTGMGFVVRLAREVGSRWLKDAPWRAAATVAAKAAEERERADLRREASQTLASEKAPAADKELARETLERLGGDSKTAGGGS